MPFVVSNPVEEEEETEVVTERQHSGFVVNQPGQQDDESFSFIRDILGPAKEFGVGALNLGMRAFGGGEDSMMAQEEAFRRQHPQAMYDLQAQLMAGQGMDEMTIQEQLGPRPDVQESLSLSDFIDETSGGAMLPQNSRQRMTQKGAAEAGEFAAAEALLPGYSGVKGLAKWAGIGGLFGLGEQVAEESGGTEGSKLGTGLAFAAAPFLLMKGGKGLKNMIEWGKGLFSKKAPLQGTPKFLTEASTPKAAAELELSAKDLTGRVAKTSEEMLEGLDKSLKNVAEPSFKDVGTFRAADIEADILKGNQKAILDRISPAAETQKKSWEGIQAFVEENFNAVKESYSKLYEVVEQASKDIPVVPRATFEAASKVVGDLEKSIIKAPEEGGVRKALEEVVGLLKPMAEGNIVEIPLEKLMAGKRSINRLLNKSDIIPGPIDLLKPVSRGMKLDTLAALESKPSIRKAFEAAENTFAEAQKVYNNDALVKMRKSQNPEELTNFMSKPSNFQKLKEAVGDDKRVKDFIDRMVVENIASKSKGAAQEMARESREFLSSKANKALNEVMEYGDTLTKPGAQNVARGRVLADLQEAMATGSRPSATLKMMQSKTGYGLVKEALNRSPRGKKMWKSLQRQSIEDMIASTIGKDKVIDFEKAKDIFSDPHVKTMVRETLGPEGEKFFTRLQTYGQNMAVNLKSLALKDPTLWETISERYLDKGLKYVLYGLTGPSHGLSLIPILGESVAKRAHMNRLYRVLENPQSRNILREMGGKRVSPDRMKALIKRFAQVSGAGSKDDEV